MKRTFFTLSLIGTILLFSIAVPVSALDAPSISSVDPAYGYNDESVQGVFITGIGFNVTSSLGKVRLIMDDVSNISATVTAYNDTSLTCTFPISGKTTGDWDVVVVNRDGQEDVLSNGFSIKSAIMLNSVSPTSAQTNDDVITVTVLGTGLSDIEGMYLYNADYDNITADIISQTSIKVIGTFDLYDTNIDTYTVCVVDYVETTKCGLEFEITTDQVGSIEVMSSPSGAKIYVDSAYMGTTPYTLDDVTIGSHKILISKTGYDDWSKWVTVKVDVTTTVNADLNAIQTTTVPTVAPTTVKTTLKANTVKVPTPWPTDTPTQASALEPFVILGAVGVGFVILRKH